MDKSSVLTCWKDIAKYMGKGVRTVQRWEEEFGLPVRRPTGSNKKAVLARTSDLDAWVALRCGARNHAPAVSDGQHSASIMRLTALSAQLETSRQLQSHNRELLVEMCTALDALRQQILSLQVGQ
jgi:predicted DNA-binding transcriptional regulator AlpA